jgi:hypothetical protein
MGIENGQYVGTGEGDLEDDVSRGIVLAAGVLAEFLSVVVLGIGSLAGLVVIDTTVGLGAVGGSVINAIAVSAFAIVGVDVLMSRAGFSPIEGIAGILGVTIVLPFAVIYLHVRRSEMGSNPQDLATLAGAGATWRLLAAQMFKRRPGRPVSDGGQKE